MTVGNLPSSIAVDQATDTVYVTILGDNTVAVFSGATCNALVTAGCGQAPAHIGVGPGPFGIFADDANHTVYVGNPGPTASNDTMSMINTLTCNGSDLAGCAKQKPPAVPVGVGLDDFDVNQATHTMYVGFGNGAGGVAAFDARTCNARALSGCGHIGRLSYPQAPFVPAVSVDSSNNTIYAAGATNTIAAFDGRKCNADDLAGCAAAQARYGDRRPARVLRGRVVAGGRCAAAHGVCGESEGRHPLSGQHRCLQRQAAGQLRAAAAAHHSHRRGPRIGRPQPGHPDAVHRQPGHQ